MASGAYKLLGFTHTAVAGFDASLSRFRAIVIDSAGLAQLPSAGGAISGILMDKGVAGVELPYQFLAIAQWECGGTVAVGDTVMTDSVGRMVTASATDISNGKGKGLCHVGGSIGQLGCAQLLGTPAALSGTGIDDVVLNANSISNKTNVSYVQVTGTKAGTLADGIYAGQEKRVVQSVATGTPVGTITGNFMTLAGVAAGTLALGTAVGTIVDFVWNGTKWRQSSALGGTASTLS